jgi:DNA repair ATPase RecN
MNTITYANLRQVKVTKRGKEIFDRKATMQAIKDRLKYLRGEIEAERISYGEIVELQELASYIDPSDTLLMQWTGA